MTHLFLFTLGPVQSFIAQARKTHDLHSGSKLLSDLCQIAAKHFESEVIGGKVIFPSLESRSIPNRFLGKIIDPKQDLTDIGESVATIVQDYWKKLFDKIKDLLDGEALAAAQRQIEQHLDIQWLFQPLADDSDEAYRYAYDELNKNLNALKNTRPFLSSYETGRKCSLDGERNVCFYRKTLSEQDKKTTEDVQMGNPLYSTANLVFDYSNNKSKIKLRHLQPGEGLSAVSMLKRFLDFGMADFPSTAEFALSETMHLVRNTDEGKVAFQKMMGIDESNPNHINWQFFYPESLNEVYFKKQGLSIDKLQPAIDIQAEIERIAKGLGRKLEKYYALVVFDGDHMGKWWKGDDDYIRAGVSLETFHKDLTSRLAIFADEVRQAYDPNLAKPCGWVIYAGGDDFLGFFNLHHLVSELEYLRKAYRETVHDALTEYIVPGKELTFSAGVCIAHYKEPLSLVLAQARDLEHRAKELNPKKKDAFGIGVIPGSGQTAAAVLPFTQFGHLAKIIADLHSEDFSNAFVSKARTELTTLASRENQELSSDLWPVAQSLLDRAVERACNLQIKDEDSSIEKGLRISKLQTVIHTLFEQAQSLSTFLDALDIADFIKRQTYVSPKTPEPAV